ncbi:vesicle-associated membrane protein-associated protein B-like [Oppia nitens]|uniref:vesicle-associated membrane protein-associated protein B-like n=1 Tax=Oppia nitens TaxID=1686743 RepID=UPI0023DA1E01|nr:vesicle-associated membrane protein-associated protein B-like [Oppia nitens]
MSKQEQVLILEPKVELHFKGPFTDVVTSYLKLTNPSDRRVCFKVKTTAPKRYCVRPNNGLIEAYGNTTIAVMLQPVDLDNLNDKNKHKFMVQTMFAPEGDVNQDVLWKEVNPEAIMDSKLKCVFDMSTTDNDTNVRSSSVATNALPLNTSHISTNSASIAEEPFESIDDKKKFADENKRLREELASIRTENLQLKEDGLKHRIRSGIISQISGDNKALPTDVSHKLAYNGGLVWTPQLLAIAFLMLMVGVIIGKMF